jgi:hypothetical protein
MKGGIVVALYHSDSGFSQLYCPQKHSLQSYPFKQNLALTEIVPFLILLMTLYLITLQ